ncbi:MAG: glycosyltransferase [Candidatus Pacebacteria bacterium]|nr:glycosyltransferase [Candidatus Paceibacterota bacterium]
MKSVLVTMSDKNHLDRAKQVLSSAYFNAPWHEDMLLLSDGIGDEDLKWFTDRGILVHSFVGENPKKYPSRLLLKLELFTPFFKKWEHVVYLDSDMMVYDSLKLLTTIDTFAAMGDMNRLRLKDQFVWNKENNDAYKKFLYHYNINEYAFNAGMIAFNTDIITKALYSKMQKFIQEYFSLIVPERTVGDQPILNLAFYQDWIELTPHYNYYVPDEKRIVDFQNSKAAIYHFAGNALKPWNEKSPFYMEWKENLAKAETMKIEKN